MFNWSKYLVYGGCSGRIGDVISLKDAGADTASKGTWWEEENPNQSGRHPKKIT
jgi:hypothetical protein